MKTSEFKYFTINKNKYSFFHVVVFILTFYSYLLFHASRKIFSNVKSTMSEQWVGSCSDENGTCVELKPDHLWNQNKIFENEDDALVYMGILDTIFLSAYAIGLFISGILGDRFNLRIVLFCGMTLTAICLVLFAAVTEWTSFYNKYFYAFIWIVNGFAQSTGMPTVIAVMGNWFSKSGRGLIFGIWSANASVGNIVGAVMAASFLKYGYMFPFIVSAAFLLNGAVIIFFGLVPSPKDIGMPDADEEEEKEKKIQISVIHDKPMELKQSLSENAEMNSGKKEEIKPIGFIQALLLPGVIMYSLCYACLKMVNYSFLFWLPFYLSNKFDWPESEADTISIWYDVGGIFGGIIGGLISDMIKKRSVVIFVLLGLAIPSLYISSHSSDSKTLNAFLMSVVGFFVGGASNMISATITADLGRQGPIQGNKEGLATVTGIVDGTGSVGAALGQILVPIIQVKADWYYVFYLFITLCVLTNVCILPLFYRECKELREEFLKRKKTKKVLST